MLGWTSRPSVHWIASVIGVSIYTLGVFTIFQCVFIYIPLTYPQYAASLFAGNDLCRSALAAGAILFARPLFLDLGVAPGVSLLAGLTCVCIVCPHAHLEIDRLGRSIHSLLLWCKASGSLAICDEIESPKLVSRLDTGNGLGTISFVELRTD
jgi:hypothetical protein